jgi:Putative Na+/H+ antiporter
MSIEAVTVFPTPLDAYPVLTHGGLLHTLKARIAFDPFNLIVTGIFALAILHTFLAARFMALAHAVRQRHDTRARARGLAPLPSVSAELLHFLGEVEVVFGLWAVALLVAIAARHGWSTATHYLNSSVNYTEPLFVVVIMALASTRPIIALAENALRKVSAIGGGTPGAWWFTILTIGPLLGSLITEPAAMTISALLLARQFYDLRPSTALKYATLGLLFVNVSVGGTLTHFAAPPVLMVARAWGWDTPFMLEHFGWRAALAILASNVFYLIVFRRELMRLAQLTPVPDVERSEEDTDGVEPTPPAPLSAPLWVTAIHILFMAWTVVNAHYPVLFIGGFLFFLGFARATSVYQSRLDLRAPLLVGFFLGGLVIHGGLQAWWIGPVLSSLSEHPLYLGATLLTGFNDNALITYLATLVPNLAYHLKVAVLGGAVTGGGLTVIANAPNPAGYALLSGFFDGAVAPLYLFAGALIPTLITIAAFRLL